MNLTGFTDQQKAKLLDLLLMGMYADGHLARAEEARIQNLLAALQFPSLYAKDQFVGASLARVRSFAATPESLAGVLADLAGEFATPEVRRRAAESLEVLLASDSELTDREREFLVKVRGAFEC